MTQNAFLASFMMPFGPSTAVEWSMSGPTSRWCQGLTLPSSMTISHFGRWLARTQDPGSQTFRGFSRHLATGRPNATTLRTSTSGRFTSSPRILSSLNFSFLSSESTNSAPTVEKLSRAALPPTPTTSLTECSRISTESSSYQPPLRRSCFRLRLAAFRSYLGSCPCKRTWRLCTRSLSTPPGFSFTASTSTISLPSSTLMGFRPWITSRRPSMPLRRRVFQ
mmetsp:Transcript_971/g.1629  ORF Transcript_971/g.1629 Transcript_971/m.1629 type:complete len:222 (-) Transcript_971:940-1605(-)